MSTFDFSPSLLLDTCLLLPTDTICSTTPLPPIRDLLKEVSAALSKGGHIVVPVVPPRSFSDIQRASNALFSLDGDAHIFTQLRATGEPLISWLKGKKKEKSPKTIEQARQLQAQRAEIRTELLRQLWRAPDGREIDALIMPVAPHPVPGIDRWGGVNYTASMVYLDYCAGVVPVRSFTEADKHLEFLPSEQEVLGTLDKGNRHLWEKKERDTYLGTPLVVQVIAPTLQERRLIRAMGAVDAAVKGVPWNQEDVRSDARVADAMGGMAGAKL